ncbi:trigger factor [Pontibacter sp. G13]|uniref:trigger factor n=1 Tax=Pontibacter sp. G13 TaxID=3074898 RepID=UPI00288B59B5|nr:trigger factor [Pontibacter sp. G13]WNJ19746.1 trigger factor [Pontibacter sp. G13]
MNITLENTGNLTAEIKMLVAPADYKEQVDAELKRQARRANMPGFRPGKVPVGVIRKMVGTAVVIEELNKLVGESLTNYIQEEKLNLLGDPLPVDTKTEEDFDPHCEKEMEFDFEVGLAPDFDINYKLKKAPQLMEVSIDDKFLDQEIENYRDRFGEVTNPEEVAEGDIVYGKLYELDDNGEELEGGFSQMIALNPLRVKKKTVLKPFFGKAVGFKRKFDPVKVGSSLAASASLLFIDEAKLEELKDKNMEIEVKRINRVSLAEMNEEFFKKVAEALKFDGDADLSTEEGFKAALKAFLENDLTKSADAYYRNKLQTAFIEQNPMEFPAEFLKKWLVRTRKEYTEERAESEYEDFSQSLVWTLIVEKVMADNEDLKVSEEDLKEEMRRQIREAFASMGDQNFDDEMLEQYLNHSLQNREMVDQTYRRILDNRVFDFLKEQVKPKNKEITATKFVDLIEKEKKAQEKEKAEKEEAAKEA